MKMDMDDPEALKSGELLIVNNEYKLPVKFVLYCGVGCTSFFAILLRLHVKGGVLFVGSATLLLSLLHKLHHHLQDRQFSCEVATFDSRQPLQQVRTGERCIGAGLPQYL